jgi:hypothetical protein
MFSHYCSEVRTVMGYTSSRGSSNGKAYKRRTGTRQLDRVLFALQKSAIICQYRDGAKIANATQDEAPRSF